MTLKNYYMSFFMVIQLNSLYLNFSEPDYFFLICVVLYRGQFCPLRGHLTIFRDVFSYHNWRKDATGI